VVHQCRLPAACVVLALCAPAVQGQAPPHELFVVCGSQPNGPTVYFSGVMQGPATAFQGFHNGFVAFLSQRYDYKGAVGCAPANTAAIAQNALNARATALRNQKKNVVETGWVQPAALAAVTTTTTAAPAAKHATGAGAGGSAASGGNSGGGSSQLNSILSAVLGTGGTSGGGGSAAGSSAGGAAHTTRSASTSGTTGDQGGAAQLASTLATAFSSKSSGSSDAGAQSSPATEEASQGLGSAQAQNTKLVVYGCGRQGTQVACVTELTNQNQRDTLIQSAAVWKDTFIVDDRGDRHLRSDGFFLNIDGDQRPQLDVSYGKTARFILMFDGVPAKVQRVALRSTAGGLDVEDISLLAPGSDTQKH
jgi:hypothetical protein